MRPRQIVQDETDPLKLRIPRANYTGGILKGDKPANMPVYQSTKFGPTINFRAYSSPATDLVGGGEQRREEFDSVE